jgi:hypothetical protein
MSGREFSTITWEPRMRNNSGAALVSWNIAAAARANNDAPRALLRTHAAFAADS